MNIAEAKSKIKLIKEKLIEIQEISSIIRDNIVEDETGSVFLPSVKEYPEEDAKIHSLWEDIQRNVPPGFSVDSNLIRHLNFNESGDWLDISERDVPRELIKVEEYKKQLHLIDYLDGLHPEVSRVTAIVLSGDLDGALKIVYSSLDSKIREFIKAKSSESTVSMIGKAFNSGLLVSPQENHESVRNFLQGVLGYYRGHIVHNKLPSNRNRIDASLSLFALAHEAFNLFDLCSKPKSPIIPKNN